MDLDTFAWLLAPPGQALLGELATRPFDEGDTLRELERLRRQFTPAQASAALETTLLRRRARAKFAHAERLYFTREALEQASAAPVAAHRAARLAPHGHVADLGCGIGGDALALATAGARVLAVERDPLRLALARANAETLGLAQQMVFLQRDLLAEPPPPADALFCDPGRRAGGRRRFAVEAYEPPLSHILAWRARTPALAVKLAPGVETAELPADAELEFVSLDGELKEAVLWSAPLAGPRRRASLLSSSGARWSMERSDLSAVPCPLSAPAAYLYEPDPAIIRAGLVTDLGAQLGAAQLDPQIAYLTAPSLLATPFARVWPVHEWLPFSLKLLRARVRAYKAGPVTVKKRGSPLDTDALARQLSGTGEHPLVVVLTQHQGRPIALLCDPPLAAG